jgi:hypothetical protein
MNAMHTSKFYPSFATKCWDVTETLQRPHIGMTTNIGALLPLFLINNGIGRGR